MKRIVLAIMCCTLPFTAIAESLSYPELQVTPRASERLLLEAKQEHKYDMAGFLPIQLSALSTFASGLLVKSSLKIHNDESTSNDDDETYANYAGISVGLSWMALTTYMSYKMRPYAYAHRSLKKLPTKTKRQRLIKERLSEEAVNELSTMGKRMRWLSFLSNAIASGYMLDQVEPGTTAATAATKSAVLSFLPLFFKTKWERVATEQEKYKRRIYSPVAMAPILVDPFKKTSANGISLLYQF